MAKILVTGIRLFAYHGCMDEEAKVGRSFQVDVMVEANLGKAETSDRIMDTINYVTIFDIVAEEMAVRSKLIEHVGKRIFDHLKKKFPQVTHAEVTVTKLHPPIHGNVESTSVVISG